MEWKARIIQWLLERGLGAPPDVTLLLGNRVRQTAPYVRIETRALWAAEPFGRKMVALLRGRWQPDPKIAEQQALDTFKQEIFGDKEDWGHHLGLLNDWHLRRDWELTSLTEGDLKRADALSAFTVLTRLRYTDVSTSPLNLKLPSRAPHIVRLIYPMVAKMPLISVRYFLDLHVHYAFDAIRSAKHPHADDVIAFLYELLFLQQKVAISLLEYVRLADYARHHKGTAQLINAEVNAIMGADATFAYLKASVEKTIALVGAIYGISGLDSKKEHRARVKALRSRLPAGVEELYYTEFLFDIVGAEHLEDLNNYRSGLLHKKGIADLQPHNYVGQDARELPLARIFGVLHEQHSKNTAALLVALALLTDDLVRRDPPPFALEDIPREYLIAELGAMAARSAPAAQGDASSTDADEKKVDDV